VQNSFFYGTILWVKLFCFISYNSVAQLDSSVVLNTIQISSVNVSDKSKIEKVFNIWQNTPTYNGVYQVNNTHTQQNTSDEIEQLFLLQSLFLANDCKENIFSLKHYTLDNYSNNLQQSQRWLSTYSAKNRGVPKNFPLWGNELVDVFGYFKSKNIYFHDLSSSIFFSPVYPKNWDEFDYKIGDYEVIDQKLLRVIHFTSTQNTPSFKGKIAFDDTDSLIKFIQIDLNDLPAYFGVKIATLDYFFTVVQDQIVLQKLEISYQKSDLKKGKSVFKLEPSVKSFPNQNAQLEYGIALDVNEVDSVPKSLSPNDLKFIYAADSAKKYWTSPQYFRYLDSVYDKKSITNILFTGFIKHNHAKGSKFWIAPVIEQMNWIGIGGYRQNLEGIYFKKFANEKSIQLSAQGDYGFKNSDFTGRVRAQYNYNPKKLAFWDISVGDKYKLLTFGVPLQNFISRGNYVRNQYIQIKHANELWNGVVLELSGKFSNRTSIRYLQLEDWSNDLFGTDNIPLDFNPYKELIMEAKWTFTPFQKYEMLPYSKRIIGSKFPTFIADFNFGVPSVFNSIVNFVSFKTGFVKNYETVKWGRGRYQLIYSRFLQINHVEFPNYNFFPGATPFLFLSPMYAFQSLNQTLRTLNPTTEIRFFHEFNPLIRFVQPQMGAGFLNESITNLVHHEVFYGLVFPVKISSNHFKFSINHVINTSQLNSPMHYLKFGINIFNNFSNSWIY
jgi:hypothetical protein